MLAVTTTVTVNKAQGNWIALPNFEEAVEMNSVENSPRVFGTNFQSHAHFIGRESDFGVNLLR